MSQAGIVSTSGGGGGVVNSVTGTNGVTASTTAGAVIVSGVNATTTTVGVASFNSADFTVSGGAVSLAGTGGAPIQTITGNTGGAEIPAAGNFNVLGTGSITIVGSTNTETVQLTGLTNHNLLIGAGTATITKVAPSATSGVALISQGASVDPIFGTVAIAGGGTNATSFSTTNGLVSYNGTSLISSTTALINSSNQITNTSQPSFHAAVAGGPIANLTGDGTTATVIFNNIEFQQGSGYNNATGVFTAPVTGKYLLTTHIVFSNLSVVFTSCDIYYVCTAHTYVANDCNPGIFFNTSNSRLGLGSSVLTAMTAGDTARIQVQIGGGTKVVGVGDGSNNDTWFTCVLLC